MATDAEVRRAIAKYREVHWGLRGEREVIRTRVPDPFLAVPVVMGHLVSVTYRTEKFGDRKSTDYEHEFGPKSLPLLCFNESGLIVCGGSYRVTARGIVG